MYSALTDPASQPRRPNAVAEHTLAEVRRGCPGWLEREWTQARELCRCFPKQSGTLHRESRRNGTSRLRANLSADALGTEARRSRRRLRFLEREPPDLPSTPSLRSACPGTNQILWPARSAPGRLPTQRSMRSAERPAKPRTLSANARWMPYRLDASISQDDSLGSGMSSNEQTSACFSGGAKSREGILRARLIASQAAVRPS